MLFAHKIFISENGEILEFKNLSEEKIIVGTISFDTDERKNFSTLYNLEMKEPFRGKGFAKKLRTFAINLIKDLGINTVHTNPESYNDTFSTDALIDFYKKNFKDNGAIEIKDNETIQGRRELIALF